MRSIKEIMAELKAEHPPIDFGFESKEERIIREIIQYCRHLEKQKSGDGFAHLRDLKLLDNGMSQNTYDAIKMAISYPDAEVIIKITGYRKSDKLRELQRKILDEAINNMADDPAC